ncbi:MAG: methyltransferase [Candidatus Micrarchaeota archaeon]|nr:methyltransferase [Candidatus Micrarchaeota archaeon]
MAVHFDAKTFEIFPGVYEPAEDSLILAEEAKKLSGTLLDMGTGCGIVAICAERCESLGVDVNKNAVKNAKQNAKANKSNAKFFVSNLFEKVEGKFDTIAFNPPYLPSSPDEKVKGSLELALTGGKNGRGITDRFLSQFKNHLAPGGRLLLVQSSLSDKGETRMRLEKMGFAVREISKVHMFFEEIYLLEASEAGDGKEAKNDSRSSLRAGCRSARGETNAR